LEQKFPMHRPMPVAKPPAVFGSPNDLMSRPVGIPFGKPDAMISVHLPPDGPFTTQVSTWLSPQ